MGSQERVASLQRDLSGATASEFYWREEVERLKRDFAQPETILHARVDTGFGLFIISLIVFSETSSISVFVSVPSCA